MLTFIIAIRQTAPGEPSLIGQAEEKDIDWRVGDSPPNEYLDDAGLTVLSVMAEGPELEHIIGCFRNLPYVALDAGGGKRRSCVWRGDMARFIFDNL